MPAPRVLSPPFACLSRRTKPCSLVTSTHPPTHPSRPPVFHVIEQDVKQFAVKVNPKDLEIRLQAQVDQGVKNLGREITTRDAYGLRSVRTTTLEVCHVQPHARTTAKNTGDVHHVRHLASPRLT